MREVSVVRRTYIYNKDFRLQQSKIRSLLLLSFKKAAGTSIYILYTYSKIVKCQVMLLSHQNESSGTSLAHKFRSTTSKKEL